MTSAIEQLPPQPVTALRARLGAAVRSEAGAARLALATVALHVADDSFLQPNPGVSPADHLPGGGLQLAVLVAAAAAYSRVRAGLRATIALLGGFFGLVVGSEAVYYTITTGPSGDDFTGLVAIPAGLLLLALGVRTLWRSRRRDDAVWWRHGRRLLLGGLGFVAAYAVLFPAGAAYVFTHTAHATVPAAHLGAQFENVEFTTRDGLRLKGWYVRSRNGAAVISLPGRQASSQARARLLARHGYGVLLFDRRGEGESDGDPNVYGWQGKRDIVAAVEYLRTRPDVERHRIGGIGLSVGGEMLIDAAARSEGLAAIVSEGASGRSVRDDLANPGGSWDEVVGDGISTVATALFTSDLPPDDLKSLVPKISGAAFFIYGERGQTAERPANTRFYAAARGPKELWEVPSAKHVGGVSARPREYERRVVAFFDRYLLHEDA